MKTLINSLLFFMCPMFSFGQEKPAEIVQVTGHILTGTEDELVPVPFATISVVGTDRGAYASAKGSFSIQVRKGDVLQFSAVGFETHNFTVSGNLENNRYSMVQMMTAKAVDLPESVVFPWPDKNNFAIEFLDLDVENKMKENAKANLDVGLLKVIQGSMHMDGDENQDNFIRNSFRILGFKNQ